MGFLTFQPLLLLFVLLPLAWTWKRSLVDREPRQRHLAAALRALGILLLVLALCRPFSTGESSRMHVVFVVDVSESIEPAAMTAAADAVEAAISALAPGDTHTLSMAADGTRPVSPAGLRAFAAECGNGTADAGFRAASRLDLAMLGARLWFPDDTARRLVLFSDGVDTGGGAGEAVSTLVAEGIDVRFSPMDGLSKPEAAVLAIEPASRHAFRGEMMRMRVRLLANRAMSGQVRILNRGVVVAESRVQLAAGRESVVSADVAMAVTGPGIWEAELVPDQDWFAINNKAAAAINVKGEPRVLVLHRDEKSMRPFARAMEGQGLKLEVRGERGLPDSLDEMLAFDGILLADVPATNLSEMQMRLLNRYVGDFGGGLGMLGSENSFGLGGYYRSPVEEALPLVSRYEKEKQKPSLAMVLVMDKSGSMDGLPIEMARRSATAAAELLSPQDQIALIGFDDQTRVVLDLTSAADRAAVSNAIESMTSGGGTDLYPAMVRGKEMLVGATAKVKHMIILSDGQTPAADFDGVAGELRAAGVTVSTVALGDGAARELMQGLAEAGGGRFYETNDPANMPRIFTKETMQASRSAIKEDVFASVVTSGHPALSGFEKAELPFVLGYVMTQPKPNASMLLAAETGDPLLAIGRFGLGQGLCYTSDLTEKWGGEWLGWSGGPRFWAQILRAMVRKEESAGLAVSARVAGQDWVVELSRHDEQGRPINRVPWDAKAVDAAGSMIDVDFRQVGLGRYGASIPLGNHERLGLRVRDTDSGAVKFLTWQRDYPREYRLEATPDAGLVALPRFDPAAVRADLPPARILADRSPWFVWAGFAALVAGIVVRRVG